METTLQSDSIVDRVDELHRQLSELHWLRAQAEVSRLPRVVEFIDRELDDVRIELFG